MADPLGRPAFQVNDRAVLRGLAPSGGVGGFWGSTARFRRNRSRGVGGAAPAGLCQKHSIRGRGKDCAIFCDPAAGSLAQA